MQFESVPLNGPLLVTPKKFGDERGFFTERFRADLWQQHVPRHRGFIQDNYSWSSFGVLRGLHFQTAPAQGKLVTCITGEIVDVVVDIRPDSATLGQSRMFRLVADKPQWVWVPPGFAHGFQVLSPQGAGVLYKVDQPYTPSTESAIRWDDPDLKIDWPHGTPDLSTKDAVAGSFADYLKSPLAKTWTDLGG